MADWTPCRSTFRTLSVPGRGVHNVLYVATGYGSLYAFDADNFALLRQVSRLGPGETPSDSRNCDQVTPEIGINATPAIEERYGGSGIPG